MATALLDLAALSVAYGPVTALRDVSLSVQAGEVLALLGRNGAGKSTTAKAVIGLVPLRTGAIRFAGAEIAALPPRRRVALGIGYVAEERRLFPEFTVEENLRVGERPARPDAPHWPRERLLRLFPALAPLLRRRAGTLSGGEQQMLAIARTLAGNPRFLVLDEPAEGLAPRVVLDLATTLAVIRDEGTGILLAEQNLGLVRRLAERGVILAAGRVVAEGPLDRLDLNTHLGVGQATVAGGTP